MSGQLTRREFLETTALVTAAVAAAPRSAGAAGLPRRTLGRTGLDVSVVAFGCGSRFLMYKEEDDALTVLESAIDRGINYLDTAVDYGNGESERRVGLLMKRRRADVRLATKMPPSARTRDAVLRAAEASLKRLQTDHVDVMHLHSLGDEADLAKIEAPDGALEALYQLRDQKVARFIGMTSHTDGRVMAAAIEHNDLDCVQMAMNPARALQFEEVALPAAKKKNLGVLMMKVTGQEKLVGAGAGKTDMQTLVRYALSLPISTMVIGMPKPELLEQNIALAAAFTPMSPAEMDNAHQQVAPQQAAIAEFFAAHADV
jgi:aryl-alcohol dehydrogenase-like predicted oxidoreductase